MDVPPLIPAEFDQFINNYKLAQFRPVANWGWCSGMTPPCRRCLPTLVKFAIFFLSCKYLLDWNEDYLTIFFAHKKILPFLVSSLPSLGFHCGCASAKVFKFFSFTRNIIGTYSICATIYHQQCN